LSLGAKVGLALVGIVALGAIGVVVWSGSHGDSGTPRASPDQPCIDLWNQDPKVHNAMGMPAIVGREAHSPNCVVILFGNGMAVQYGQQGGGYTFRGSTATSGAPDANAVVQPDGTLALK
jgi:hypothetical protein